MESKTGINSVGEEIDITSKASIVRGIHSHLQCPGCNKLIVDPRILACTHTYCRLCLNKAVRKHIRVLSLNPDPSSTTSTTASTAPPPPAPHTTTTTTTTPEATASATNTTAASLEPLFLDYNLRKILGSSLNKELEESLTKILNPDFSSIGMDTKLDTKSLPNAKGSTSKTKKTSNSSKSKEGKKPETNHAGSNSTINDSSLTTNPSGLDLDPSTTVPKETIKSLGPISTIEVLVCPECGANTEIPGGNISLMPYNFFMQHIMDLMTYYSSAEPVPLVYCSVCRKDSVQDLPAAVARCSTCASFLCKQCYELHSIDDFTKLHSTLSITERGHSSIFSCLTPNDTKVRTCKIHNWRPFVYYCITCRKGICETCSKQDHETHLFSKPEFLRSDYVSYIRDLMSRTTQLRRRTENSVRSAQDLMSGIQLLGATQTEEVLRTHDVLSNALDTRLSVLLQEVDKLAEQGEQEKP